MKLYEAMNSRRSVRKYKPDPVPRDTLEKIIAAAMSAPSGNNEQGWIFVAVDDRAMKGKIAEAAQWGRFIEEAGACVAIFCDRNAPCEVEDCSAATENLLLAAVAEGLGACWVNSYREEHAPAVEELLNCPYTHELVVLVAVGAPAGETPVPKKKTLEECLRWNGF
jgi:nitroreductase